jgi:hypothetical protein
MAAAGLNYEAFTDFQRFANEKLHAQHVQVDFHPGADRLTRTLPGGRDWRPDRLSRVRHCGTRNSGTGPLETD